MMTWKEDYQSKVIKQDKSKFPRVTMRGGYLTEGEGGEEVMRDELVDYVSPYVIVNHTGYPIEVETDTTSRGTTTTTGARHFRDNLGLSDNRTRRLRDLADRTYKIEHGGRAQYLIESNIEDLFKQSTQEVMTGLNHIKVLIKHPEIDIPHVTGVDIDRGRVSGYRLEGTVKGSGDKVTNPNFKLFADVRVEKSKKVITLTSSVRFTNHTKTRYEVHLEADNNKAHQLSLNPGESSPVPLDFITATVSVRTPEGNIAEAIKRPLAELMGKHHQMLELNVGHDYVLLESHKRDAHTDFYEIALRPTISIKNCCGLDLAYRITSVTEEDRPIRKLKPQEEVHETGRSIHQPLFLQVRSQGFFWSEEVPIYAEKSKRKGEYEVVMKDAKGNSVSVYAYHPEDEHTTRRLFLYTKACIVNETPYEFEYSVPAEAGKAQIGGQVPVDEDEKLNTRVVLVNDAKRLTIARKDRGEQSGVINVSAVGSVHVELATEQQQQVPAVVGEAAAASAVTGSITALGLDIKIMECDREHGLLTKVITISPRYVLINKTGNDIEIKREGAEAGEAVVIRKDQRQPLEWPTQDMSNTNRSIIVRPQSPDSNSSWSWSNGLDITAARDAHFLVRSADRKESRFLRANIALDGATVFIVFEDVDREAKPHLKIRNDCAGINIRVYQDGANSLEGTIIKSGQTVPWSWEFPTGKWEVLAEFSLEDTDDYLPTAQPFRFDNLNHFEKIPMPELVPGKTTKAYAMVLMEGSTRVLTFFTPDMADKSTKSKAMRLIEASQGGSNASRKQNVKYNLNVDVIINAIGVSVIGKVTEKQTKKKERRELIFLLAQGVQFKMLDASDKTMAQLRVKYLNIDNNTTYNTSFPVLLTPSKPHELDFNTNNYFLDFVVSQRKTQGVRI